MSSVNSSKSHRFVDFLPSIRPSFLSVVLLFACGCLWVKNETTNERLIALETRTNMSTVVLVDTGCTTENSERTTRRPKEDSTRHLLKFREKGSSAIHQVRGSITRVQKKFPYFLKLSLLLGEFHISHTSMCGASGNGFLAPSFWTEIWPNFLLAGTRAWKSVCSFMMCLLRNG